MYVIEYVHTSPTRSWLAAGGGGKRGASGEKERGRTHHHTTHVRTYLFPLSYQSPKGEELLSPLPTLIARACPTVLPSIRLSPSPPPLHRVSICQSLADPGEEEEEEEEEEDEEEQHVISGSCLGEERARRGRSLLSFCSPLPSLPLSICGARRISQPYFSFSPPLDPCTMYILGQLPHSTFVSVQKDPVLFVLLSPSHLCSLCILASYYSKQSFLTPSNHSCYQPLCHMYLS